MKQSHQYFFPLAPLGGEGRGEGASLIFASRCPSPTGVGEGGLPSRGSVRPGEGCQGENKTIGSPIIRQPA